MGWTSYHASFYKNGKIDRKAECDSIMNCDMVGNKGRYEVLKSTMVGSTYYAAVKRTIFKTGAEPEKESVFGVVMLTSVNNKDYYNFSYKDIDESAGPCYYDCPKGILDLLTPTEYEWAKEWRERCYENIKRKKSPDALSNLPVGSEIKFTLWDGTEKRLVKHPAAYQFSRPFWMNLNEYTYVPVNRIPKNYEVIRRGAGLYG